jgi:TatD DNase family protein
MNIELFDSHAHYDDNRFKNDYDQVIKKAMDSGVKYILNAGADIRSSKKGIEIAQKHNNMHVAVGVHPHDVKDLTDKDLDVLADLCKNPKVVAVGEIGLDYYYDNSPRELQKAWFEKQIDLAKNLKLPVIVHDRDAHQDCMDIIKKAAPFENQGVFHCFAGSLEMATELLKMNFYLSVGGPVTFKNAKKTVEIIEKIPLERLLIETDCPYLAPEPHRGERNDSSYVLLVAQRIAQIRNLQIEEVAKITTDNAKRLFRIK